MTQRDFLLLDGDCGLCHRLATFIDKRLAKEQDIGYRPINSDDAQQMIAELPKKHQDADSVYLCLLYTSPSPRDRQKSRMPSSA